MKVKTNCRNFCPATSLKEGETNSTTKVHLN